MDSPENMSTLTDINEMYDILAEEYPTLPTHRLLDAAIAVVKVNALQRLAYNIKRGLVIEEGIPSGLEAIAMQMGYKQ